MIELYTHCSGSLLDSNGTKTTETGVFDTTKSALKEYALSKSKVMTGPDQFPEVRRLRAILKYLRSSSPPRLTNRSLPLCLIAARHCFLRVTSLALHVATISQLNTRFAPGFTFIPAILNMKLLEYV